MGECVVVVVTGAGCGGDCVFALVLGVVKLVLFMEYIFLSRQNKRSFIFCDRVVS